MAFEFPGFDNREVEKEGVLVPRCLSRQEESEVDFPRGEKLFVGNGHFDAASEVEAPMPALAEEVAEIETRVAKAAGWRAV